MNFCKNTLALKLARWICGGLFFLCIVNGLNKSTAAVTVDDFWRGTAHFDQVGEIDWAAAPQGNAAESSSWFVARLNVWYAFNRVAIPDPEGLCPSTHMRIVVRESRDQGKHWSVPKVAAEPGDSAKGDGCAILDGSAFFDESTGTWHLLAQCSDIGNQGGWAMCHYSRTNPSPMGQFLADPGNPVVKGGDLWGRICSGPEAACPATTADEGTPEILAKDHGRFLVTFHGFDYPSKAAFRGMAYTPDFRHWSVKGSELPNGPLLGAADCIRYTPHCVGVGQASTLSTGRYIYVLAEAMDKSLQCLSDQQWMFYLYRAPKGKFPRSGSKIWDVYAHRPFLKPSSDDPETTCKVTYARWIRDGSSTYVVYEDRITRSARLNRRLLKLMPGAGLPVRLKRE